MPRSSNVFPETGLGDGYTKSASVVAAVPVTMGSVEESDGRLGGGSEVGITKTTTKTTASGGGPLLGKGKAARASDDASTVGGTLDFQDYAEGGIRAWLVVLGCWLALFASLGFMNALATFQAYITTTQSVRLSPGAVGGTIFGYASFSLLLGLYAGPLFDKYGPRWLLLAGTLCLLASLLITSISTEYASLLSALAILSSMATPLLSIPSLAAIGHFFHRNRGLATGVATTASSASGVVFPFLLQALYERVGWAWAMRALALICLTLAVAANFLIRARPPPSPSTATPHPHARIFLTRGVPFTVLAVLLAQFAAFLPLSYLSGYALSKGFTEAFSFEVIAVLNASSALGRVAAGWAADRAGPFNTAAACAAAAAIACFAVWLPAGGTQAGMVVFAVVFGAASGGGVALAPVVVGRLCKTREYGRYYGACNTVASMVVLLAIPVAGQLVKRGSYWGLVVTTGAVYVAAAAAFVAARMSLVGWRIWKAF